MAARAVQGGEGDALLAGGVESMTRAPLVQLKPDRRFARGVPEIADTTIGWRFVNPRMEELDPRRMGETAENVAERYEVTRADQDAFALSPTAARWPPRTPGRSTREIVAVEAPTATAERGETCRGRRGPAPRHHAGEAGQAAAGVPRGRDGDRRQRVADQRRRRLPGRRPRRRPLEQLGREPLARIVPIGRGRRRPRPTWAWARSRLAHGARARRPDDRRHRPRGDQRGVRRAGARLHRASSASPTRSSTSTAARSRSAIRSAAPAPAWSARSPTSSGARASATAWPRCASASARGWRRSSRTGAPEGWTSN